MVVTELLRDDPARLGQRRLRGIEFAVERQRLAEFEQTA